MNKIKVISLDIDGTLTAQSHEPEKQTIDTLVKLQNKGYLLGLASGRTADDLKSKYKLWGMNNQFDFIIGWNGAELWVKETDTKYEYNLLPKQDLKEIIELMNEFDVNTHMYLPNIYLSSHETDRAWYSAFKNKRQFVVAKDLSEFYKVDNAGIMFRCKLEQMPQIEAKIASLNKNYVGFKTQPDMVEFSHKNCNKGFALTKYCQLKNIYLQNCMAFGDTSNDNEMLKICNGVCMLNGSDDTKACAKYITEKTALEFGFNDFVYKHLL